MRDEHLPRVEVVHDGVAEEPADGVVVQIHREKMSGAGGLKGRREHARRNWLARFRFAVLARVAEIRHYGRHLVGRCASRRVYRQKQAHPILCGRIRRLNDVDILAAEIFEELYLLFTVAERAAFYLSERFAEPRSYLACKLG